MEDGIQRGHGCRRGTGKDEPCEPGRRKLEEKFGEDPEFYYFYNSYGYFLLTQDRVDEAIEKFKKQVSLAPEEANPYDSLGEAYRIKGMLDESLKEYKKAYSISPSDRVKEIIEELKDEIGNN